MASHLPVVGLLADGVRDLIEHEQNGMMLNVQRFSAEETVREYRRLLTRLVENSQLRHEMGSAALASASRCPWFEAMECLIRGYREVIENANTLVAA